MLPVDPSIIEPRLRPRAVTFENPTGAPGAGGRAGRGRKGAAYRNLAPGEQVVLADVDGPGVVRHIWMTFPPAPPEVMRSMWLQITYDGNDEPSIDLPATDFFCAPLGRPVAFTSALMSIQEGRGFNCHLPLPFKRSLRVTMTNGADRPLDLYHQIDLTLQDELPEGAGYLHTSFHRQNPTTLGRDFEILPGVEGPGRFVGCNVGIRTIDDGNWYGEGEVKLFLDGDDEHPTICGTGLEDYVGTAWGMGPHHSLYAGAPLDVRPDLVVDGATRPARMPEFVGFYRWHLLDPVNFAESLRVTIQQIGAASFASDEVERFERFAEEHPAAGSGWQFDPAPGVHAYGLHERVDDYCATAYVYLPEPRRLPTTTLQEAVADIERRPHERPGRVELAFDNAFL